jgi:hypothetical protein
VEYPQNWINPATTTSVPKVINQKRRDDLSVTGAAGEAGATTGSTLGAGTTDAGAPCFTAFFVRAGALTLALTRLTLFGADAPADLRTLFATFRSSLKSCF